MGETLRYFYSVEHHVYWGVLVAAYFLYTGISAGSFFISGLGTVFNIEKFKPFSRVSAVIAAVFIMAAPIHLLADLEQPARFWNLFIHPHFTSAMSWGVYLLLVYAIVTLRYTWLLMQADLAKGTDGPIKLWGAIGLFLAFAVESYTGLLLADVPGRVLWHTPLMPFFFSVSAVVSAIALILIVSWMMTHVQGTGDLANLLPWFLFADFAMLVFMTIVLWKGSAAGHAAAYVMLLGPEKYSFLVTEALMGLIVPFAILVSKWGRENSIGTTVAAALTLIGVVATRINIVILGQRIPMTGDRLLSYHISGHDMVVAGVVGIVALAALAFLLRNLPVAGRGSDGTARLMPNTLGVKEGM